MKDKTKNKNKRFRVVIFGSSRIEKEDENWNLIYDLARKIAEEGMDIVTGGGPGLMDAASEGHFAGDKSQKFDSIGLQIKLPKEQRDAFHLDVKKEFYRFSNRLDSFIELANLVVVASGGVGTLLELLYTWQLLQVKMIFNIPIILLGEMWSDFINWIKKWPLKNQFLDKQDLDLLFLADNSETAFNMIKKSYKKFKQLRI
jgi:uncharacterized protein (TIGR00730 family)